LSLIYDMALKRLVDKCQYPVEILSDLVGTFDPKFSIRGLAVDRETGWICHLSYTHKTTVAWEGREKVSLQTLLKEYNGKRALRPSERKKRLKPLNDIFSMAECCLVADTIQWFKDRTIPFFPRSVVTDVLGSIGGAHISGDFHRIVAANPEKYFEPQSHLADMLRSLKSSGKKLLFVSNSPFWYVDAGMKYAIGEDWRDIWDAVIVSAGKPNFYTDDARPFREVSSVTGRIKFKKIDELMPGEVYCEGSIKELTRCFSVVRDAADGPNREDLKFDHAGGGLLLSPSILYIGDSLFADLVDAKREFGWTTATVCPELRDELEVQRGDAYVVSEQTIHLLLQVLRRVQGIFGTRARTEEDRHVLDGLERCVSECRDRQNGMLGNTFGSVFRARYQPSLFASSIRRYCDLYMSSVECLRYYSPEHRFYPEDSRLLSHEPLLDGSECWDIDDTLWDFDPDM